MEGSHLIVILDSSIELLESVFGSTLITIDTTLGLLLKRSELLLCLGLKGCCKDCDVWLMSTRFDSDDAYLNAAGPSEFFEHLDVIDGRRFVGRAHEPLRTPDDLDVFFDAFMRPRSWDTCLRRGFLRRCELVVIVIQHAEAAIAVPDGFSKRFDGCWRERERRWKVVVQGLGRFKLVHIYMFDVQSLGARLLYFWLRLVI